MKALIKCDSGDTDKRSNCGYYLEGRTAKKRKKLFALDEVCESNKKVNGDTKIFSLKKPKVYIYSQCNCRKLYISKVWNREIKARDKRESSTYDVY